VTLANYLRHRGATCWAGIPVPEDLQETLGKAEIVKAVGKVRDR
jgi:hypothetical protein